LAPNYIPSIFPQLKSPAKRKLEESAAVFQRREATKRKRLCAMQQATQKKQVTQRQQVREQDMSSLEGDEGDVTSDSDEIIDEIFNCEEISNADDRVTADQTEDGICNEETLMMPSTEDGEPVFRCDFCKGLEGELSTSKQQCKHLELVNEKLTAKVVSRESLCHDDIKVQYYTGLPSYEILEIVFEFVTDGLPDILLLALVMCLTNSSWF